MNGREPIDEHFLNTVSGLPTGTPSAEAEVDSGRLLALFDSQAGSRHLDFAARQLGSRKLGYYSIGSSGHESNAAVADALRPTDPALLHYRSGGFYVHRARQVPGHDPLRDVMLGVVASADEPVSAGRHKVFGHGDLGVIPQTSTIASHLPRAVGLAFSLGRATQLGVGNEWAPDSVVVCSFGDASANHSTATGAINSALHCAHQGVPMPLLLVCEDNGIGISVRTPRAGSSPPTGSGPGCATSPPTGTTRCAASTSRARPPTGSGRTGRRRSCTCGRSA
ncbi:thiamine pyrophosphate-dependent enzyme [Saccharopolyspora spinosporotrichia]